MDLFQDVKTYQNLVQLENHMKIVKSQDQDCQHAFGIMLHLLALRNLVSLLALQIQWDFCHHLVIQLVLPI